MRGNLEGFKYKGNYYAIWEEQCKELFVELHASDMFKDPCQKKERIDAIMKALEFYIIN